jgi:hypothetical protein
MTENRLKALSNHIILTRYDLKHTHKPVFDQIFGNQQSTS